MSDLLRTKISVLREQYDSEASMPRDIGVPEKSLNRFLKGSNLRGEAFDRLKEAARQFSLESDSSGQKVGVREPAASYLLGVLEGQAQAVRQFLESAIQEQDNLIRGIRRMAAPELPPPVSREVLDATGQRQLAEDAAATGRRRRKAAG